MLDDVFYTQVFGFSMRSSAVIAERQGRGGGKEPAEGRQQ
jgi:hypothetical protein